MLKGDDERRQELQLVCGPRPLTPDLLLKVSLTHNFTHAYNIDIRFLAESPRRWIAIMYVLLQTQLQLGESVAFSLNDKTLSMACQVIED